MYWNFCFRNLTRAETVRLETIGDSEVEARKLAQKHLESIGRPTSAFVSLRPTCPARSHDYPELVKQYGLAFNVHPGGAAAAAGDHSCPSFQRSSRDGYPPPRSCSMARRRNRRGK